MLKKPDAILFDWDDTIVDTWHIIHAAINKTLQAFGYEPWSEAEAHERMGPPARVIFTQLYGNENWEEADRVYLRGYREAIADKLRAHDSAEEVLRIANELGIYCAVVSSKRNEILQTEAEVLNFKRYFKRLVGAKDAVDYSSDKPSKIAVDKALEGSGLSPDKNEIWFIGDSITDLQCAENSGCKAVLVETKLPPESKLAQHRIDARFKNMSEIKNFLISCGKN